MRKINTFGILILVGSLLACNVKKTDSDPVALQPSSSGNQKIDFDIGENDWNTAESTVNGVHQKIKSLNEDKLQLVQRRFSSPFLTPVTFPEAHGFELYHVDSFKAFENKLFIHPKLFISTSTDRGSILGYRKGRDERGREMIGISIPMALVNGMVPAIPLNGDSPEGNGAVGLPTSYRIPDVSALTERIAPETLETLPACPQSFRLQFQGQEYPGKNPLEGLSICPLNQFFRVEFEGPVGEMNALLEQAAIQPESVTIIARLDVNFSVPKKHIQVFVAPEVFRTILDQKLTEVEPRSNHQGPQASYAIQDLESAVIESFYAVIQNGNLHPLYSQLMGTHLDRSLDQFFARMSSCPRGGLCRTRLGNLSSRPVEYSWTESEIIGSSISTRVVGVLGASANSSPFMAKPSREILEMANRPAFFRGKNANQIMRECSLIIPPENSTHNNSTGNTLPNNTPLDNFAILFPGVTGDARARAYVIGYCREIQPYLVDNLVQNPEDPDQQDGYFPLGTHTTVYPGAWIKLDINKIDELTTAKFHKDDQDHMILESEIEDMLVNDPASRGTHCVEGDPHQAACLRYAQDDVALRDPQGNEIIEEMPCNRGEPGCVCQTVENVERCTRRGRLTEKRMRFECDPSDTRSYCPYFRTENQFIRNKETYHCDPTVSAALYMGCALNSQFCLPPNSFSLKACSVTSSEPVLAERRIPTCIGDDPTGGIVPREIQCRNPHYVCAEWNPRCIRYAADESFEIVHEETVPKWRSYSLDLGDWPRQYDQQVWLKFASPAGTVANCRLDRFQRIFRGNSRFIKLPSLDNDYQPCDQPLWNASNSQAGALPQVYIKNAIRLPETRLCGRTEYSMITPSIPNLQTLSTVPPSFRSTTQTRIGPLADSCRHENPLRAGSDLIYVEVPPILISGRVSVLGRMLEGIISSETHSGGGL